MATARQREALLAIPCSWCHAAPGEPCSTPAPGGRARRDAADGVRREKRTGVSTLDGGCHDARWQAAGMGSAPVLGEVVARLHNLGEEVRKRAEPAAPVDTGRLAYASGERPW